MDIIFYEYFPVKYVWKMTVCIVNHVTMKKMFLLFWPLIK